MKLFTIAAAYLLLIESSAAQENSSTSRMRSVKLYSSTPQSEVVDPYIGVPDEREQRSLQDLSMSASLVSEAALEMSMPTVASNSDLLLLQSFSYSLQDATEEDGAHSSPVIAAAESAYNGAWMTTHSSAVVAATIVSAIAGVVALM